MAEHESTQGGARVRIPPPLVFVVLNAAGIALGYFIAPPPLPGPRALQLVVGGALVFAGIFVGGSAFRLMRRSGQDPRPWTPATSLLARGIYRYTRNPMYVGMTLLTIALGFLVANLWIVIAAALYLLIVHYTAVLPEEAYLDEKFGEPYREYKKQVRRYL